MNQVCTHPQTAIGQRARILIRYGVVIGLAAAVFVPAELPAAPFALGVAGQTQSAAPELLGDSMLLAHCCHSHPYEPYDSYCCHEPRYYAPGAAIVGGAVAYGTYRAVRHHVNHHHNHYHGSRPRPRRR